MLVLVSAQPVNKGPHSHSLTAPHALLLGWGGESGRRKGKNGNLVG